jgi:hypothetical protein
MPIQTPTERPSLTTTLEERYANQKVGGAFDAKEVRVQPIDFGHQNKTLQNPTGLAPQTFSDKALNTAAASGHTTQKYKP